MSHPMRVRGLKSPLVDELGNTTLSHPMRVRGLKCKGACGCTPRQRVAPHAGAWIEIILRIIIAR